MTPLLLQSSACPASWPLSLPRAFVSVWHPASVSIPGPFVLHCLPLLLCAPAWWPAQGVQLCSCCQQDLHRLWWLLQAPLLPHYTEEARGSSGQKRFLQNMSPKSYACMFVCVCVCVYLFKINTSNQVPLGTCNVTKSGQCFHGAEGMLVNLESSSACMEILDLEWIEVGKSIWAWK